MQPLGAVIAAAVLWLIPTGASACDWPVAGDVFGMSQRAERIAVVEATGTDSARVVANLRGGGPAHLRFGANDCEPRFVAGERYLLFTTARGAPVSDRSAARLVGRRGERLIAAVRRYAAARSPAARRAALIAALAGELVDPPQGPDDWRLLADLAAQRHQLAPETRRTIEALLARRPASR